MNLNGAEKSRIFLETKTNLYQNIRPYTRENLNMCCSIQRTLYQLPGGTETETELRQFGFFSLQVKLQKTCKWRRTSLLLFLQSPLLAWTCSLLKLLFHPAPTSWFIHSFGHTACWNRTMLSPFFMSSNPVPGHMTYTLKWMTFQELFLSSNYNESQVWK